LPGEVVVDGRRIVEDLVRWQVPIRELYLAESVAAGSGGELACGGAQVWEVEDAALAAAAATRHPQGVLAVVDEPRLGPWPVREGVALYLEEVQDPGNVGAMVRAAAGLGAAAVLLSEACADPFHPAAVRGSAGAVFRLSITRAVSLDDTIQQVRVAGGEVWASGLGGVPVAEWRPRDPLLLLIGAEGRGLSTASVAAANGAVTIPLERGVESLNAAVAAGVLLEAFRRARSGSEPP
jgi:TrmH family RNA methyltransferase